MLNNCFIMGRLTRDPELRRTKNGTAVTSFTLAVEDDYQNKDAQEKDVDFIDCVAWQQRGEMIGKYFTKGRMALVNGKLKIRTYTDKEGNKRKNAEIMVESIYFADSKKNDQEPTAQQNGYGAAPQNGGYGAAPQNGGYGAAPQNGYGTPAQGGNYGAAPQNNGGYGAAPQNGYGTPAQGGNYGAAPQNGSGAPGNQPAAAPAGAGGNQYGNPNPAYGNWPDIPDIEDGQLPY